MKTEEIHYKVGDKNMVGFVAYPDSNNSPLVLIAHAWGGKDTFVHDRAKDLAMIGYTAMAVDMYGDGKVGADVSENEALMTPLISNRDNLKQRIQGALEIGRSLEGVDPTKVAAIGYCFGGLVVLDLARAGADVKGVVSFHGLLTPSSIADDGIKSKILVLHGERDPMVPLEMVDNFQKEMTGVNADWQLHSYGGTYHSFTNFEANDPSLGTQYNQDADKRSWRAMLNFFDEVFS
ncbi:dienelactone hydrolase family protein [Gammaproteobacteria bacterium]|nr:dienelactone hydrolase family protein [Gammaproteobacteria bacterium]